jgi:hypothetical protein
MMTVSSGEDEHSAYSQHELTISNFTEELSTRQQLPGEAPARAEADDEKVPCPVGMWGTTHPLHLYLVSKITIAAAQLPTLEPRVLPSMTWLPR